ncbi:hypothetical protein ACFY05_41975 [Microtetraspora fusca]|uniref:Uncharacterized protein n=1 Tax=Microtetraspora fusca TaxID=1997 RepID=A0ABW6VJ58_MICFU
MAHVCSAMTHPPLPAPVGGWQLPLVDDRVLYRADCVAELVPAVVVEVELADRHDLNVWADGADGEYVMLPDPNPNVLVELDGGYQVSTRQIRVAASPGWCWPHHDN